MGRGKAQKSLDLIDAARAILREIQPATVRAVCYRLFVANVIDNMSKSQTNKVSRQLTWAREEGIIPWHWIVDETREAERISATLPSFDVQTKRGDPRYAWYRDRFPAGRCWELDVLSPVVLRQRVEHAILDHLDLDAWHRAEVTEAAERESLTSILTAWSGISRQAPKYEDRP